MTYFSSRIGKKRSNFPDQFHYVMLTVSPVYCQ